MKYQSPLRSFVTLIIIGLITTSCSYNASKYGASEDNVNYIKKIDNKINVSQFTSSQPGLKTISCRAAGTVETPDNMSFEEYIHNAFVSELSLAGKYDKNSPVTISGHLEEIDFDSNIGTAQWRFTLKVTSSNSKTITVKSIHEFSGSFVADKACQGVAQEFVPAVQHLIKDIITDPGFEALNRT
jgi:hypothetical protein